ncbi:MAG: hypothetical protein F4093_08115 [Gammaproteobacteria bacterium]|nr:hypothetical protein [Gammaproteobacteria bacterium]MYJ52606.1 hypothetical protein [Gammaproteobacteria bacterium]
MNIMNKQGCISGSSQILSGEDLSASEIESIALDGSSQSGEVVDAVDGPQTSASISQVLSFSNNSINS